MITYKLFLIVILFTTSVLSRNTGRGNIRHRQPDEEYKYNHPPEPESYEAIPVAVLYEEDSNRNEKSIKSEITTKNNVAQVDKEPLKGDYNIGNGPSATEEEKIDHVVSTPGQALEEDQNSNSKVHDKSTATVTAKFEIEQQIPVAVVYEPEASYYNEPRPKIQRVSSKRRRVRPVKLEQIKEEKKIEISVNENENTKNGRVADAPDTQERLNSYDKSTSTPKSHVRVSDSDSQERFSSRDKSSPTPISNVRVSDSQERLSNSEESVPVQSFAKRNNSTRQREVVPIIQSENLVFSHSGDFQYSYEGGDGTKAFEKGQLKTFDDDNAGEAVSGGFSYTAKDGNEYSLSYTADENGYRPVGAHLPTPPPIPPAIARALAYLATKPTPEPVTESIYEADYS